MGYKLSVNHPNLPKGGEVMIPGLGTFKNGETVEISDERAEAYQAANGTLKEVVEKGSGKPTGETRREPGPPLDKALADAYGIKVEKMSTATTKKAVEGGES